MRIPALIFEKAVGRTTSTQSLSEQFSYLNEAGNDDASVNSTFEAAVEIVQASVAEIKKTTQEQQLQLATFYKQAIYGDCNREKPSMLNVVEYKKWSYWESIRGMSTKKAKMAYVDVVVNLGDHFRQNMAAYFSQKGGSRSNNSSQTIAAKPVSKMRVDTAADQQYIDSLNANQKDLKEIYDTLRESKDVNLLKEYIDNKTISVNSVDANGMTPLHLIVDSEIQDGVEYLLQNGADIEAEDTYGRTALHMAVDLSNEAICDLLLFNGASSSHKDQEGVTPYDSAQEEKKLKKIFDKYIQ